MSSTTHPLVILQAEALQEWIESLFQIEYTKEVFHILCNLYRDRKIVQKTICMLGHINEKQFSFE